MAVNKLDFNSYFFTLHIVAEATFVNSQVKDQYFFNDTKEFTEPCVLEKIDIFKKIPKINKAFPAFESEMCLLDEVLSEIKNDKKYLLKLEVKYEEVDEENNVSLSDELSKYDRSYNFDPFFRDKHSLKTKLYQEISSEIPDFKIEYGDIA